ncbi:MAG: hypothetical protein AVDCRST_MAG61-858 [uncultured Friedmanniella sp.]|uniref:Predicted membrane protein YciQ-like C-terminal domain-containing protein n=1 Tax=uncultured Friedmanniella sp. TaxID=335381 RepID=A0A6J4K9V7_9ACTN|nr:DUF2207 domain-containing protein [uncultured Friedmanniella sp.]CAA9299561.1 MAG: hypothetical protein AVDCRST_MAG61-858 [uncultured Friedmanniella sp.]
MLASSAVTTPARRRVLALLAAGAVAAGLWAGPLADPAHAEGTASTVVAEGSLDEDGTLRVTQTVTFAGAAPERLEQRFETRQDLVGDRQYVQELSAISATAGGAGTAAEVSTEDRFTTVSVPTGGASEVVLDYTVTGAVVGIEGGETALRWPLLQGLSASVEQFEATVEIPGAFTYIRCTAGSPNSAVPCDFAAAGIEDARTPTFRDGPRGEGEVVIADIGFPAGAVTANEVIDHRWTVGRAFSVDPLPLGLALGLLLLGALGLFLMHRRTGVDHAVATGEVGRVAEFAPIGPGQSEFRVINDIRPGHIGTVADERVDPIDITATLVDLAVRGHLRITELPRETAFARTDWELSRCPGDDVLQPFEQALLDGVVPQGSNVLVSHLAGRVSQCIGDVQDKLYDEVVSNGWYEHRPDSTRSRWTQLALTGVIAAVVITVLLAAFTTFGLVGLALIVLALGLVFVAQEMPSRTAKGSALLDGLGTLRSDLLSQPTSQMPSGRELEELSQVLPYAIVLGGSDRWLDALVAHDTDDLPDSTDLSWYHGPAGWHLRDLPDSLRNFITTVTGSLFTR